MKKFLPLSALLIGIVMHAQINTQTRDNAGLQGSDGATSGFFETVAPVNYPVGASGWWHLLDVRHSTTSNNYAMQFSGSFFDQSLYFRKTNNNPAQPWRKIVIEDSEGRVGIGSSDLTDLLTLKANHHNSTVLLHADNIGNPHAYLTLWASEPQLSYTGVGMGNNIKTSSTGAAFSRIVSSKGATYFRLLENEINFNIMSESGVSKQILVLRESGNVAIQGKLEAKEVKVTTTPTADFVFEEDYALPKLEEVESFIKENKHLPEIASAAEMEREGVNIGEFQIRLLQKIEELTLYSIEQNKLLKAQAERIKKLEELAAIKK